jgi:hypothetical protein
VFAISHLVRLRRFVVQIVRLSLAKSVCSVSLLENGVLLMTVRQECIVAKGISD